MSSAFTPGPWQVSDQAPILRMDDCILGKQIWGDCRVAFTERQNVGLEAERANARLIAAAPELLDALRNLSAYFSEENYPSDLAVRTSAVEYARDGLHEAVVAARMVIAKAEGR